MADVAHDASDPASPTPGDIAPQVASRPESPDRGKLRVFISYSREDLDFADQLAAALDSSGFECFIDRQGISGGEAWERRLGNLISEADTVVFVLSPDSARAKTCNWEVEEAARLNKRILPANWRPLESVIPPTRLRDLNYIFFYKEPKEPGSGFGTGLAKLVTALNTDFDWLRGHTRYLQRATEWDRGGRPANRLLSGDDIAEAKAWAARRPKNAPEPTTLHLDFIRASEEEAETRLSEQRKQLEAVAAAQAEREKALHEASLASPRAAAFSNHSRQEVSGGAANPRSRNGGTV
jgi:TIR domain